MGRITKGLQYWSENISSDRPWLLRLNGIFITLFLISISGLAGWSLEQLTLTEETNLSLLSNLILLIALASGLATKSLLQAVQNVIKSLLEENEQKEQEKQEEQEDQEDQEQGDPWRMGILWGSLEILWGSLGDPCRFVVVGRYFFFY